jgi:sec-independent protein translocase protein TatA
LEATRDDPLYSCLGFFLWRSKVFGVTELIIIFVVILLFFGARKLPELGRALGQSAKEFKKCIRKDEIDVTESSKQAQLQRNSKDEQDS